MRKDSALMLNALPPATIVFAERTPHKTTLWGNRSGRCG